MGVLNRISCVPQYSITQAQSSRIAAYTNSNRRIASPFVWPCNHTPQYGFLYCASQSRLVSRAKNNPRAYAYLVNEVPIDQLPDTYRILFTLWVVESFATTATAKIFGQWSAAVKTRVHRTRLLFQRRDRSGVAGYPPMPKPSDNPLI